MAEKKDIAGKCEPGLVEEDLMRMLGEGPLVFVKEGEDGSFELCTAVIHSSAPPAVIWAVLGDFESYREFIPRLKRAEVRHRTETSAVVALEIDTPVYNTRYAMAYELRQSEWKMLVSWHSGDLRGTSGEWRLVPTRGGTTIFYSGATRNFSRVIRALEDDKQTLTVAVNVSSALAMVRAIKERSEALHTQG